MRNRCSIKTATGSKTLSIPLKAGKNQQLAIKEVEISYDEDWVKNFQHGLITNYSSSPYLDYYIDAINQCLSKHPKYLWTLNWELNQLLIDLLDVQTKVNTTQTWKKEYGVLDLDYRNKMTDLDLTYKYPQLFEEKGLDFLPNQSILDLLFCCGPEAKLHLRNIADQIIGKNNM